MSEEEMKAVDYWKNYMEILHWNTQLASEHYMKVLLDLIEKQQKEIGKLHNIMEELNEEKEKNNRIKELEADNYECNNRINDCIETINKIQEEFLKYDWKNSNNEQIYNQLKSLYNEIFKKTEENRK